MIGTWLYISLKIEKNLIAVFLMCLHPCLVTSCFNLKFNSLHRLVKPFCVPPSFSCLFMPWLFHLLPYVYIVLLGLGYFTLPSMAQRQWQQISSLFVKSGFAFIFVSDLSSTYFESFLFKLSYFGGSVGLWTLGSFLVENVSLVRILLLELCEYISLSNWTLCLSRSSCSCDTENEV